MESQSKNTLIFNLLTGAVFGGVLATFFSHFLDARNQATVQQSAITQKYLMPAQDAAEAMWFRLNNIKNQGGLEQMSPEYFQVSTLYAIGRLSAFARVIQAEGMFVPLEDRKGGLGKNLRSAFQEFDNNLDIVNCEESKKACFHRYVRLSLAESLLLPVQSDSSRLFLSTYIQFASSLKENASYNAALEPAKKFISTELNGDRLTNMLAALEKIICLISNETQIKPESTDCKRATGSISVSAARP